MSRYSICIINVYFGQYPNYFDLWIESAKYNSTIDFLMVTDQEIKGLPQNVHTLRMDLKDFSVRATKTIGMSIIVPHAYKCCDFKVAYGLIFEKELKGYDFWGYCDVDLIWGDLRSFVIDDILDHYEKIYPMGHLALYRNTEQMRKAFMLPGSRKGDYKEVFTHSEGYALDELGGIYEILEKNNIAQYDKYEFADISPAYNQMKMVQKYIDYSENYKHQVFLWSNGKVYRYFLNKDGMLCHDEWAYLHLQKRKFNDKKILVHPGQAFVILPDAFIAMEPRDVTVSFVRWHNRYRGKVFERLERKLWNKRMKKKV